jgi:GntR family transcriptional regulator/MocR family aminotransferase
MAASSSELLVPVDRSLAVPLRDQLYRQLRAAILDGRRPPGARLPSTRALAQQTGLARQTVVEAYDQLLAEGYVEARPASGTYVAETLPDDLLEVEPGRAATPVSPGGPRGLSQRGQRLAELVLDANPRHGVPRPFETGVPALEEFPFDVWARLTSRHLQRGRVDLLNYADATGYLPLREAIAEHVATVRAARCTADQVIITSGTQQAAYVAAHALLDAGDPVWVEEPGYSGVRLTLLAAGARLTLVPVDDEGLDVAAATAECPDARLAYVTPSRQFPLGSVMSLQRRRALLEWARRSGAWVLEDDYDSEFRYASRPLASLQGLDTSGCVVYLGTLSKVLFPALRLGYLIAPPALVEPLARARAVIDRHGPTIEQAVLADFIAEGHLARHVRRMRGLYFERQAVLVRLLNQRLADVLDVRPAEAGMHVVAFLPDSANDVALSQRLLDAGVVANPLSSRYLGGQRRRGLLLGFSAWPEAQQADAVQRLATVLKETMTGAA